MDETVVLTADQLRFVEEFGLHFESLGVPRIGGRVFALLLIAPRPLTLDEVADLLVVSRASVSTNTRLFIQLGIVEPWTMRGDRRRYYVFARNAWEHRLHLVRAHAAELRRLVAVGQSASGHAPVAAQRLETAGAFAEFLEGAAIDMMDRWRAQVALDRKAEGRAS